ncbi:MAG: hypothetical protein PHE68_04040 [Candidatus Peribacteraceae bacterium]|nr:hypothetical protein [Candidatus Peribacteraceae bacterium]
MRLSSLLLGVFLLFATVPSVTAQGEAALTVQVQGITGGSSVPPGSQRVPMLNLSFTASCKAAVTVHAVTVRHRGMGAIRDLFSVYAESDGRRVARGRVFSSRAPVLTMDLENVVVPACGTRTVHFLADISAIAAMGGEHRLTVENAAAIDAGGASVRILSSAVPSLRRTVGEFLGSVTVEYLPLLSYVRYGDHRIVARLRLSVSGERDQLLKGLLLTNGGSARDGDLVNIFAEMGGKRVTRILPRMEGDLMRLAFDPSLLLPRSNRYLLDVRADVRSSMRKTIKLTVEEPSDVVAETVTRLR